MTDRPEVSPPSPTARGLFENVDALMRRNRRAGTEPLPPPEGQPAFAEIDDETQNLSAEIEAELEAELVKELSRVEDSAPLEAASPLAPELFDVLSAESSEAPIIEEAKKEAEEQVTEALPETAPESAKPPTEDDLLLWEFAPQPKVAAPEAETETIVEPTPAEIEEGPITEEPLAPAPSFSDAVSFLSPPEVLAPPSQGSASYVATPPTVAFDGMPVEEAAEEEQAVAVPETPPEEEHALAMPEILPEEEHAMATPELPLEDFPEETASSEDVVWLLAEETDETYPALDAGSAIGVAEALAPLSGVRAAEAAEDTATGISWPKPAAELWRLVESEFPQEAKPVSAETEAAWAAEAEKSAAEETRPEEAKADRLVAEAAASEKTAPEMSAMPKAASPVLAEVLLPEQQRRDAEAEAASMLYSAAQLLTEYQHQHPQAQNIKAVVAAPPLTRTVLLPGLAQALADEHDSLSTFNESARKRAKAKQAEKVSPLAEAPAPKETSPGLTFELLPDIGTERSAAPAGAPTGEDDYYPVLTDIVDEDELPASGKA